jgi:Protein phosphatase 2C
LASAIEQIARSHARSCDLANPYSPTATVIAIRVTDRNLEYLVLGDSTLICGDRSDKVRTVTDRRLARITGRLGRAPHSEEARQRYMRELTRYRNRRGGFWVAGTQPEAARHACTGTVQLVDAPHIALMSDGASRLVDRYRLATWNDALTLLLDAGPAAYLQRVRHAEASDPDCTRWPRSKNHDDATAAILSATADPALTNLAL